MYLHLIVTTVKALRFGYPPRSRICADNVDAVDVFAWVSDVHSSG